MSPVYNAGSVKNVYSVFRYNPPSVGFAKLSAAATQLAQEGGDLPTPTTGAHPIIATGSATSYKPVYSLTLTSILTIQLILRLAL